MAPNDERNASVELLAELDAVVSEIEDDRRMAIERMPAAGYAVPMLVDCAEVRSNNTVDHVLPWGFADFSAIYRNMLAILNEIVAHDRPFHLYFNSSQEPDPAVNSVLDLVHIRLMVANENVAIKEGLRAVKKEGGRYCISLSMSRRRSALTLLHVKATYLQYTEAQRELLNELRTEKVIDQDRHLERLVALTLQSDANEIDVLRNGMPAVWQELLGGLKICYEDIVTFLGFTVQMWDMPFRWHDSDTLYRLCTAFAQTYDRTVLTREVFDRLLAILSSNLEQAGEVGTVVPFITAGNWVRFWPFAYHVMLPELVFVMAVQSKYERLWSRTFGAKLALAANYLVSRLPSFDNIITATLKRKTGLGDVDLAIFDLYSRELLICEIKTVFDKFRTDFQLRNFSSQKVNFEKAVAQLDRTKHAIEKGDWKLSDIFGKSAAGEPTKVRRLIVLWRDQFNPTVGGQNYVPVVTFNSFVYLFTQAGGNLVEFISAIEQLERVFWVTRYVDDFWPVGDRQVLIRRELETDALPPLSYISALPLTGLAAREIDSLRHFPEDWKKQAADAGDDVECHFTSGPF